jgi:hypothetical protein
MLWEGLTFLSIRHVDHAFVTSGSTNMREAYSSITGGAFNNSTTRL